MDAFLEAVVVEDLAFDKSHLSEVGFEASEGLRPDVEVRPFPLQGVVVRRLEEGQVADVAVQIEFEVAHGGGIAGESIGEEL